MSTALLIGGIGTHVDYGDKFFDGKFGVRANGLYGKQDIGVDETDGFRGFASLALDFNPTDNFSIQVDAEHIRKKMTEPTTYSIAAPMGTILPLPPLPDPKKNLGGSWQYGDGYENNLLVNATYRFARDWEVSVQAGRSYLDRDRFFSQFQNYNLTTGNGTVAVTLTNGNINENNNLRSELCGAFLTGVLKHELTVGVTQNEREAEVTTNPVVNFPNRNLYDPQPLPFTPLPARVVATASKIEDRGVYVFDRLSYDDWLQVLVGARYTDYSNTTRRFVGTPPFSEYSEKKTSPAAGLVSKPRPWLSLYGTYIEGLEEGGIAPTTAVNSGELLPAGISEQTEFGVKLERGELLLTLAYFDIDRPSSFVNSANVFVQDGRSTYSGFEFSATGEVTEQISVYATAMSLDAEQVRTANPLQAGLRPENTPELTASLFAEYRFEAVPGLSVSGGAFHVGDRAVNALNQVFVGGYTTYDVGARYSTDLGGNTTILRFYVDNLTNKRYWAATGTNLLNPNLPRTAKLSMTMRF